MLCNVLCVLQTGHSTQKDFTKFENQKMPSLQTVKQLADVSRTGKYQSGSWGKLMGTTGKECEDKKMHSRTWGLGGPSARRDLFRGEGEKV